MRKPHRGLRALLLSTALLAIAAQANAAKIVFIDRGGFAAGSPQAIALQIAGNFWAGRITNDITLNYNVRFATQGPTTLATANSRIYLSDVQDVYGALAANAETALDLQAVANLSPLVPGQFSEFGIDGISMLTPGYTGESGGVGFGIDNTKIVFDDDGSFNNAVIGVTSSNMKALGLVDPDALIDGTLTFNTLAAYDFHPENGIDLDAADFIGVAIHEIGHALGFTSGVDDYDRLGRPNGPVADVDCGFGVLCGDYPVNDDYWGYTLDLFRYGDAGFGPQLAWVPGLESYLSIDGGLTALGAYSTGIFHGDGFQASHWKFGETFDDVIGIMDPAAFNGEQRRISGLDFAAFDVIGYNFNFAFSPFDGDLFTTADVVPEPSSWALMIAGFGLAGAALRRRSRPVAKALASR